METTEDDGKIEPMSPEDSSLSHQEMMMTMMMPRKKKGKNNKRRFSDEQVRSLETIFESETKLEPRKKVQVARELGLQPRQVAIWFQNKRARWKSKQIEKNYRVLKASFDSLKVQYDSMKKEKDSLLLQMQELRSLVDENQQKRFKGENVELGTENREEDQVVEGAAFASEPASGFKEELVVDYQGALTSDDDRSGNLAYIAASEDQPELLSVNQHIESSFIPPAKWCSFDSGGCLYDQSLNSSQWWESLT